MEGVDRLFRLPKMRVCHADLKPTHCVRLEHFGLLQEDRQTFVKAVQILMTERAMGVTRACGLVGISRSLFQYESRRRVEDEALTSRMMAIAAQKRRYGYRPFMCCCSARAGWQTINASGGCIARLG